MAPESFEPKTVSIPPLSERGVKRPIWPIDDRAKTAIRELQEGELLQLVRSRSQSAPPEERNNAELTFCCRHRLLNIQQRRFNS